jgi:hypothetical protein
LFGRKRPVAVGGAAGIRLYYSRWANAWPDKKATTIEYSSRKDDMVAAPFCVAIAVKPR